MRFYITVLLLIPLSLLPAATSYAQWSEDGVWVDSMGTNRYWSVEDHNGGIWIAYEDFTELTTLRVQRLDANGFMTLGPNGSPVIDDSLDALCELFGIVPIESGGIMVFFSTALPSLGDTTQYMYVQKYNENGARMLGPVALRCFAETMPLYPQEFAPYCVCPDINGGGWVLYKVAFVGYMLAHFDEEGNTLQHGIILPPEDSDFHPAICEDGNGGVYYAFSYPEDEYYEDAICLMHYNQDGEPLLEDPVQVLHHPTGYGTGRIYPDGEGGVILHSFDLKFQRISSDYSLLWGENGIRLAFAPGADPTRQAVVLPGGGLALTLTYYAGPGIYPLAYLRINPDGSRYFPDWIVDLDSPGTDGTGDRPALTLATNGDLVSFRKISILINSDWWLRFYTAHRFNPDTGENTWGDSTAYGPGTEEYDPSTSKAYSASDGTTILLEQVQWQIGAIGLKVYKIMDDGTIVDDILYSAPEHSLSSLTVEPLTMYPNPFNGSLIIDLPTHNGKAVVKIANIKGQVVYRSESQENQSSLVWEPDISLASGIYFAVIRTESKQYVSKALLLR